MLQTISPQRKKAALFFTLLLIVALISLASRRDKDYFEYQLLGGEFDVIGDAQVTIEQEHKTLTVVNDSEEDVIVQVADVLLMPAVYSYDFQYAVSGEGAPVWWRISSGGYLYEDNRCGVVFVEEELGGAEASFGAFEINQQTNDVSIAVHVPSGRTLSIGRITVTSDRPTSADSYVLMGLAAVVYAVLMWALFTKRTLCRPMRWNGTEVSGRRVWFGLVLIFAAITVWGCSPLFSSDISGGYDLLFHINRIEGIAQSLSCGQFPVRIHAGMLNGHGYPNGIFYPELLLYFPALLRMFGMSLMNCYKVLACAATFATAAIAYVSFAKLLRSRSAGLLAALVYTINPYRLACVFERSAVGEYLAMMFLPMVLYGLCALLFEDKRDWKWLCLGATGILQCHILTTEITAAFCGVAVLVCIRRLFGADRRWIELLKTAAACVLLNLWFVVPFALMSLQLGVAVFDRNPLLSLNAIEQLNEMFSMTYQCIFRVNGPGVSNNGFGFVNLFALALLVLYVVMYAGRKADEKRRRLILLGMTAALTALFCGFAASDLFPWDEIQSVYAVSKIVSSLQFPFRLFGVMMLCFAVVDGVALLLWTKTQAQRAAAALCAVAFAAFSATIYLDSVNTYANHPHMGTQSEYRLYTSKTDCISLMEYVPAASDVIEMLNKGTEVSVSDPSIKITGMSRKGTSVWFDFEIENYEEGGEYYVLAPLTYYPGYSAVVNGERRGTHAGGVNYVQLDLAEQQGSVEISYRQPTTFAAANAVSTVTAAGLAFAWGCPDKARALARRLRRKQA